MSVAVISGNPRTGSRTAALATDVGARVAAATGLALGPVVDLAELGPAVLDPDDVRAAAAHDRAVGAAVLVVATPVYKGSYTGLLKSFLDRFAADALAATVVVPVVVAGSGADAGAAAVHLRAVLAAVGGQVVLPGVVTTEAALPEAARAVDLQRAALRRWVRSAVAA